MENDVNALNARLDKAKEVFKEMKTQMTEKDNEINRLNNLLNSCVTQEDYDKLCNEYFVLKEMLTNNEADEQLEELNKLYNNLKTEYNTIINEHTALKTNYDTLKENYDLLNKQYEYLKTTAIEYQKSVHDRDEQTKTALEAAKETITQTAANYSTSSTGKNYPGMYDFLSM